MTAASCWSGRPAEAVSIACTQAWLTMDITTFKSWCCFTDSVRLSTRLSQISWLWRFITQLGHYCCEFRSFFSLQQTTTSRRASFTLLLNTATPQGCVLSHALLYSLHQHFCVASRYQHHGWFHIRQWWDSLNRRHPSPDALNYNLVLNISKTKVVIGGWPDRRIEHVPLPKDE